MTLKDTRRSKIEELRKTYDSLSEFEKKFIKEEDYKKLQAYEEKLKELGGGESAGGSGDGGKTE